MANAETLVRLYEAFIKSGNVPDEMQEAIFHTLVIRKPNLLAEMAGIETLTPKVHELLAGVSRASVREQWVLHPARTEQELVAAFKGETRTGVLTALASRRLPEHMFVRALAAVKSPSRSLAEAVIVNPTAPLQAKLAATRMWAEALNRDPSTKGVVKSVSELFHGRPALLTELGFHISNLDVSEFIARHDISDDLRSNLFDRVVVPALMEVVNVATNLPRHFDWTYNYKTQSVIRCANALALSDGATAAFREHVREQLGRAHATLDEAPPATQSGGYHSALHSIREFKRLLADTSKDLEFDEAWLASAKEVCATSSDVTEILETLQAPRELRPMLWRVATKNPNLSDEDLATLCAPGTAPVISLEEAELLIQRYPNNSRLQAAFLMASIHRILLSSDMRTRVSDLIEQCADPQVVFAHLLREFSRRLDSSSPLGAALSLSWLFESPRLDNELILGLELGGVVLEAAGAYPQMAERVADAVAEHIGSTRERWNAFESVVGAARTSLREVLELVDTIEPA